MTLSVRHALSLAAVLTLVTGPALAQARPTSPTATNQAPARGAPAQTAAAAALPNAFDAPAAPVAARPAPAGEVAPTQAAEAALRSVIEQFAAGDINEALFTPGVATRLNAGLAEYSRVIQGFGPVESIEAQSVSDGVGQFVVIFEKAATQWQLGLDDAGLIAAVRFRESPLESSEPPAPGT